MHDSSLRVLNVVYCKVGFKPSEVVKSMSRGKAHDPNKVIRMEVSVEASTIEALHSPAVNEFVLVSTRNHIFNGARVCGIGHARSARTGFVREFAID
jgi:hypothetical protein